MLARGIKRRSGIVFNTLGALFHNEASPEATMSRKQETYPKIVGFSYGLCKPYFKATGHKNATNQIVNNFWSFGAC